MRGAGGGAILHLAGSLTLSLSRRLSLSGPGACALADWAGSCWLPDALWQARWLSKLTSGPLDLLGWLWLRSGLEPAGR